MLNSTSTRPLRVAILAALIATLSVFFEAGSADANGRVTEFTTQMAGPYEVSLGTAPADPKVGRLHLTIRLAEANTGVAITGADVVVTGTGPGVGEPEIGPLEAPSLPSTPADFDLDVEVDREGMWSFRVEVDSSMGPGSTDFILDVTKTNPIFAVISLVLALVLLVIVGLSVRRYLAQRREQRSER